MSLRPREKPSSTFAVACSLLSQYIKDNKPGLAIPPSAGKAEGNRPPMTMSLLPGADVTGNEERERETGGPGNAMELFPQRPGSGLSTEVAAAAIGADAREPEKAQLTIFYGGKVLVFDNFPADKARDLMQLAGKGSSTTNINNNGVALPPTTAVPPSVVPQLSSAALPSASVSIPAPAPKPTQVTDMPMARRASLHRFLEKRKDRINARAPYLVNGSSEMVKVKKEESEMWLGLGPMAASALGAADRMC